MPILLSNMDILTQLPSGNVHFDIEVDIIPKGVWIYDEVNKSVYVGNGVDTIGALTPFLGLAEIALLNHIHTKDNFGIENIQDLAPATLSAVKNGTGVGYLTQRLLVELIKSNTADIDDVIIENIILSNNTGVIETTFAFDNLNQLIVFIDGKEIPYTSLSKLDTNTFELPAVYPEGTKIEVRGITTNCRELLGNLLTQTSTIKSELELEISTYVDRLHTHEISDITGLQEYLDALVSRVNNLKASSNVQVIDAPTIISPVDSAIIGDGDITIILDEFRAAYGEQFSKAVVVIATDVDFTNVVSTIETTTRTALIPSGTLQQETKYYISCVDHSIDYSSLAKVISITTGTFSKDVVNAPTILSPAANSVFTESDSITTTCSDFVVSNSDHYVGSVLDEGIITHQKEEDEVFLNIEATSETELSLARGTSVVNDNVGGRTGFQFLACKYIDGLGLCTAPRNKNLILVKDDSTGDWVEKYTLPENGDWRCIAVDPDSSIWIVGFNGSTGIPKVYRKKADETEFVVPADFTAPSWLISIAFRENSKEMFLTKWTHSSSSGGIFYIKDYTVPNTTAVQVIPAIEAYSCTEHNGRFYVPLDNVGVKVYDSKDYSYIKTLDAGNPRAVAFVSDKVIAITKYSGNIRLRNIDTDEQIQLFLNTPNGQNITVDSNGYIHAGTTETGKIYSISGSEVDAFCKNNASHRLPTKEEFDILRDENKLSDISSACLNTTITLDNTVETYNVGTGQVEYIPADSATVKVVLISRIDETNTYWYMRALDSALSTKPYSDAYTYCDTYDSGILDDWFLPNTQQLSDAKEQLSTLNKELASSEQYGSYSKTHAAGTNLGPISYNGSSNLGDFCHVQRLEITEETTFDKVTFYVAGKYGSGRNTENILELYRDNGEPYSFPGKSSGSRPDLDNMIFHAETGQYALRDAWNASTEADRPCEIQVPITTIKPGIYWLALYPKTRGQSYPNYYALSRCYTTNPQEYNLYGGILGTTNGQYVSGSDVGTLKYKLHTDNSGYKTLLSSGELSTNDISEQANIIPMRKFKKIADEYKSSIWELSSVADFSSDTITKTLGPVTVCTFEGPHTVGDKYIRVKQKGTILDYSDWSEVRLVKTQAFAHISSNLALFSYIGNDVFTYGSNDTALPNQRYTTGIDLTDAEALVLPITHNDGAGKCTHFLNLPEDGFSTNHPYIMLNYQSNVSSTILNNNSLTIDSDGHDIVINSNTSPSQGMLRRDSTTTTMILKSSPGTTDMRWYTGSGAPRELTHKLKAVPDLLLYKCGPTTTNAMGVWSREAHDKGYRQGYMDYRVFDKTIDMSTRLGDDTQYIAPDKEKLYFGSEPTYNESNAIGWTWCMTSNPELGTYTGVYTGTAVNHQIDFGFRPRIVIIKCLNVAGTSTNSRWYCIEKASGGLPSDIPGTVTYHDLAIRNAPQTAATKFIYTTDTGIVLPTNVLNNIGSDFLLIAFA